MPFKKGNKLGKGNSNSGRKTKEEEFKDLQEKMKKQTIEELATDKVYQCLETIEAVNDKQGVKDIALPVYLKSKADKIDLKGNVTLNFDESFNTTHKTKTDSEEQS